MKRILFAMLLMPTFGLAQNNAKFHHLLSQDIITSAGFQLSAKTSHYTKDGVIIEDSKTMYIGDDVVRKCVLATDGKGGISVDFWQITDNINAGSPDIVNKNTSTLLFVLKDGRGKVGDPTKVINVPFRTWTWSIGTTPVRYRFATDSSVSTVSAALSLSFSFGRTFGFSNITSRGMNNYSITPALFVGILSADLKKETVKTPLGWEAKKKASQTNPAFSYGVSVTGARNNLGLVLSLGFDYMVGNNNKLWSYQGKPWIGLGINTSLGILK